MPADLVIAFEQVGVAEVITWAAADPADPLAPCTVEGASSVTCGFGDGLGNAAGKIKASASGYEAIDEPVEYDCTGSKGRYTFSLNKD